MYRQVLLPDRKNYHFELPKRFFGKKVEILIREIKDEDPSLPKELKNASFWEDIEYIPDFPGIEEIRKGAWPEER